ncbi:MAG TPA: FmdB family zinc ribbon protein [Nocardioidaceae bacterium]|nr:FmdB family zinc ribbon protein [Nocardioidaceae bacterium]
MPTYQYACTDCSEQIEVHQSFTDDALTDCPACEGRLRKVFNAVGVVFKGSGFYKTDSRNGSRSEESSRSDKSTASADSSAKESGGGDAGAGTASKNESSNGTNGAGKSGSSSSSSSSGSSAKTSAA